MGEQGVELRRQASALKFARGLPQGCDPRCLQRGRAEGDLLQDLSLLGVGVSVAAGPRCQRERGGDPAHQTRKRRLVARCRGGRAGRTDLDRAGMSRGRTQASATMSATATAMINTLLQAWETLHGATPTERSLGLLGAVWPKSDYAQWRQVSIGDRDACPSVPTAGIAVRGSTCRRSRHARTVANDWSLDSTVRDVCTPSAVSLPRPREPAAADARWLSHPLSPTPQRRSARSSCRHIRPKLPRPSLLQRCVIEAHRDDTSDRAVSAALIRAAAASERDHGPNRTAPDLQVAVNRPACGHVWSAALDIAAYLWGELERLGAGSARRSACARSALCLERTRHPDDVCGPSPVLPRSGTGMRCGTRLMPAIGRAFLGHLVARTQPRATLMQTPILDAADPEFTSRAHLRLPKRSTSRKRRSRQARVVHRAAAPAAQPPSRASRASAISTPVPTPQTATGSKRQVRPHRQRRSLQGHTPHRSQRHRRHQRWRPSRAPRPPQPRAARAEDPPSKLRQAALRRPHRRNPVLRFRRHHDCPRSTHRRRSPSAARRSSASNSRGSNRVPRSSSAGSTGIATCLRPQRRHRC